MDSQKKDRPLIKEIAQQLGVSIGTVSIVLNGRGDAMRISKATQQRVWDAARAVNYQPNIYARRLRGAADARGKPVVGIFWGDTLIDVGMGNFFHGLHQVMKEKGYDAEIYVQIFDTGMLHKHGGDMTPGRFSGIIVCGTSDEDMAFLEHHDFALPVVVTDRNSPKFSCTYGNNYDLGKEIALLFHQRGHRRAGMVSLRHRLHGASLRQLGFQDGCAQHGVEVRPAWVQEGDTRDYDSGYSGTRAMLQGDEHPTALFVTSPGQVLGSIMACRDAGLRVPEDVEVICYGSNSLFQHFTPSISTVHTSIESMAESAMSLLMLRLENKIDMPMSRLLFGEFAFRESCGGFPQPGPTPPGI